MEQNNLAIWNKLKHPPKEALSKIKGGRLSGRTNISPQWRYQIMTETFGVCGIGWYTEITKQWIEEGSVEQKVAFVNINLFVKIDDEWSKPIPGTGGSFLVDKEKAGLYTCDEAFKMATTDALSVAMKLIGVGSDIYMGMHDGNKYKSKNEEPKGKVIDFGSPTYPFSRENIIEFGKHSKTGDGDNKKWMELTDSYLAAIEKKVTGGYLNFVKKEIAFRANDKELKKDKEESEPPEKQTLTHGEVDKKEEETTGRKQVKKQPEKKVENKTDDDLVPLDQRKETLEKIELMRKKGHMSPVSVNKWIEIAETLNDPIEFQRFYWVVATAELVCRAGDANKINKETKIAYFKVIKDPATKISDLEPIMADVNKVMENR